MKRAHLFRHPVGFFPAAARWYLAVIAMLGLLGVGLHLSVQQQAQQQAEALILQWGEQSGVAIGNVRYHLLRNALSMQEIRIQRGADSLSIRHILVHANPRLLTGKHPRITDITLRGVQGSWHLNNSIEQLQSRKSALLQLWQATRRFELQGGRLSLYLTGNDTPPVELHSLSLSLNTRNQERHLVAAAQLDGKPIEMAWTQVAEQSSGNASWQGLDAENIAVGLGLGNMSGVLSGSLSWSGLASNAMGQVSGGAVVEGRLMLTEAAGSVRSHRLIWQADRTPDQWKINLEADAWPLKPWSSVLPELAGRHLTAGQLDGEFQWQGMPGQWRITSDKGTLYDVTYADDQLPAWYWSRIQYKQAWINSGEHRVQLEMAELSDGRLLLDTQQQQGRGTSEWQFQIDAIHIHNMMLALATDKGRVTLSELNGEGRWPKDSPLTVDLTYVPEKGLDQQQAEWRIHGELGHEQVAGKASWLSQLHVIGKNIPLDDLRAVLPLQSEAMSLAGNVDLKLDMHCRDGLWQASGKASADDMALIHQGNRWSAASVKAAFGPVGMGLDRQQVQSLIVNDWHYMTALEPLSPTLSVATPAVAEIPWWMGDLRARAYQLDRLSWQGGSFSMGRADVVWADDIAIEMRHIQPGRWADTMVQAIVGAGLLKMKGEWDFFSGYPRMRGRAQLDDALPFFAAPWLHISGMPGLIRGRLSAAIKLDVGDGPLAWQADVGMSLKRPLLEPVDTSLIDPMLTRTGYDTPTLIEGLQDEHQQIDLHYQAGGEWPELSMDYLGAGLEKTIVKAMTARSGEKHGVNQSMKLETRIRLHTDKRLSLNERTRLLKVAHKMRKHPTMNITLRPEWNGAVLSVEKRQRIRETQQAIERYLIYREVEAGRIFPVAPAAATHTNEPGSIWIETN